jgi:hypothetical protein
MKKRPAAHTPIDATAVIVALIGLVGVIVTSR